MRARLLAATSATLLAVTLSGCMTVHGEKAVVPAVEQGLEDMFLELTARDAHAPADAPDTQGVS